MGTSKSYGGPRDKIPLLPDWALPPQEGEEPPPEEEEEDQQENPPEPVGQSQPGDIENDDEETDDVGDDESGDPDDTDVGREQVPVEPAKSWRSARTLLGKAISKNGDRNAFKRAAQSYVRARGGSRSAAQTATSGRAATARLGGFLADVARRGLDAALESLNLSSVIGKDARTVFAAISNALSPDGASPEQAVAREAVNDVLSDIYERFVGEDGDVSKLNALTGEDVAKAVTDSVVSYIYRRWLQELGKQIEKKAISSAQAVSLEREAKLFVKDAVKLDFKARDPLSMDWQTDGNAVVENIFNEAYSLFGVGR